jgi:WD40 repeat protein
MKKIIAIVVFSTSLIFQLNAQTQIRIKDNAHEGGVTYLCLGNNGETAITAGEDLKTFVWNINTGEKLKGALKFADKITAVAINGNSKFSSPVRIGVCPEL